MNDIALSPDAPLAGRAAGSPSLRDRLRAGTREAHEGLDTRFAAMTAGDASIYGCFLAMNRDAHAALEPLLARSPLAGDWRAGGRLEAARRDCAAMGIAEPLDRPAFGMPSLSRAEAIGVAYVLEGSRLGAKFLLRALARDLPRNSLPTHYLEASSDAGPFAELLRSMAEDSRSSLEFDASVGAARETFRFFGRLADRYEIAGTLGS